LWCGGVCGGGGDDGEGSGTSGGGGVVPRVLKRSILL